MQVDPVRCNRLICMCDDCQVYGRWLAQHGSPILDPSGGTEILQMTPSQLRIDGGSEHVRCLRLSPKGLMRWHTGCCHTPIGNTLEKARVPFVGVPMAFVDLDPDERDSKLGPVLCRIHARYGKPPLPADSHPRAPGWLLRRFVWQMLRDSFAGRHRPSPLRHDDGSPLVTPTVLSLEERQSLNRST
ncbi:MAG: hypothetical protein IPK80_03015 [Nannocystis sp.]|nr:hypothetical protein [Nannocystis sp.]